MLAQRVNKWFEKRRIKYRLARAARRDHSPARSDSRKSRKKATFRGLEVALVNPDGSRQVLTTGVRKLERFLEQFSVTPPLFLRAHRLFSSPVGIDKSQKKQKNARTTVGVIFPLLPVV